MLITLILSLYSQLSRLEEAKEGFYTVYSKAYITVYMYCIYKFSTNKMIFLTFPNLNLGYILIIILKVCKFKPWYSIKYSYIKKKKFKGICVVKFVVSTNVKYQMVF